MKRESRNSIRALAALVLLALTLSACIAATPSQEAASGSPEAGDRPAAGMANVVYDQLPDMDGAELVAVTGNDYIPLNFIDPASGQAVGWEYDAVNEICRRLNCVVNWQVTAWEAMIQAVADEQFDVGMDGITITAERAQVVDFSDPYMTSQQFMLVRAGEDRFDSPGAFADDEDLIVGAQAGTTGFYTAVYDILDGDEANPRIRLLDSFGASVQALIAGDVDLVLVDAASGRGYIGANPEKLKIVGDALATEEFGFIFTPGSSWTQPFNAAIASMKADGFLDHLNTRWFFLTDPNADDIYDQLPDMDGAELVAVTGNDYIPLNFIDPASGQAVGWEYDAVNEICRRLNCVVNWQVTAWEAMIQAVADEQFDVGMDGITITAERAQVVDFSDPYMTSQQFMLVRAGEDRFDSPGAFADDEDLIVGAQAGTTGFYTAVYDILDGDEANPRIRLLDSFGASVQALIAGDVDLVLVDAASGRGYIGANPEKLKIVGDALATEEFGFIFTPGSSWTQPFNAAIASMKADGYDQYLNVKWFFLYDPN
ncbi:MAG: transporter substrate-binding domain-containing protein [Caldilineaceae bacterium]|nr:transporter substrate-binding domain-containing protein [Caldilineaceae bacterium]MDE0180824.1 transporter substrate-binding domain-containing protein [Caldilineaceae bacterium]